MSQADNYYGGGGYMQSPGGMNSPGGAARRSDVSHSLRPVTIKQLLNASQAHSEADWQIDGVDVNQIKLVAQVVSTKNQTTNCTYTLDDGSGRFEARHWADSSMTGDDETAIRDNSYVRVLGTLKSFGERTYINATHVQPVKDMHEIYFHTLEAMTVSLYMKQGPPLRPGQKAPVAPAHNGNANGDSSAYSAQASVGGANDPYAHLPTLQKGIIHYILRQPHRHDGVHVQDIAKAVHGDATSISAALELLMDEGHVFTTRDESHFDVSS